MVKAKQSELAALFAKSQQWISKVQNRSVDPMPADIDGARSWGIRQGHLAGEAPPASITAPPTLFSAPIAPAVPVSALPVGSLEAEELRLKGARADLLELDRAVRTGQYIRTSEVEQREVAIAAEFRHVACEYPLRTRAILERLIPDAALVDRIIDQLNPLAAELLNKSDAGQVLAGKSRDEARVILHAYAEKLLETMQ
jgi:hypothetical protein